MKSLVKKIWILPLFGLMFFWGISMMAIPSKASSLSGNSLVAATKISPIKSLLNERDEARVSIRGRIAKFKEGDALVIDDGTEKIAVEYSDKYKPLRLQVGQTITVRGELNVDRNDHREIVAEEIYSPNGQVYPQQDMKTQLNPDQDVKTRFDNGEEQNGMNNQNGSEQKNGSMEQNGNTVTVDEVQNKMAPGKTVMIKGVVVELPEQDLLRLRDSSGDILIDVDDAIESLKLKKGDSLEVEGIVIRGNNGKKELEALKIRKFR